MREITLSIPDETLLALKVNPTNWVLSFAWQPPSSCTNSVACLRAPHPSLREFRERCS